MLVLQRNEGESIIIGNDIRVIVAYVRGGRIGIGIEAPRKVPIYREEILEEIRRLESMEKATRKEAI